MAPPTPGGTVPQMAPPTPGNAGGSATPMGGPQFSGFPVNIPQDPIATGAASGSMTPQQAEIASLQRLAQQGALDARGQARLQQLSTKRYSGGMPPTAQMAPPTPGNTPMGGPQFSGGTPPTGGPQPGMSVPTPGRQAINPSDRGTRLTFEGFQLPQLNPQQISAGQLGQLGAAPDPVTAQMQGTPQGMDFSGFALDPSQFGGGGQFSSSAGGAGGFTVDPQSVLDQAMETFRSQLPGLNLDLADQTESLAKRTSALGRTGSGLFNRDTGNLSDRSRATRESLLGNLALQGATTDAGNDLQAQIATGGFRQSGADRSLRGQMANASNALNAAMTGAQLNQQGQQFDISNLIGQDQFNVGNTLQADLANQGAGLQARGQDLGARGQDLSRLTSNQAAANDAQRFNINNTMQAALEQMGLMERQQGSEDRLASEANNNIFRQLGLLGQGFAGDPTGALQGLSNAQMGAAGQFGANAGQLNQQMGGVGGFVGDMLGQFASQPRIPSAPPAVGAPAAPDFTDIQHLLNL